MNGIENLTGIAIIVVFAALIGLGMVRLRQPAIVGYILAGVVLGPTGLGLVEDRAAISQLAELGVILLLFFIGMELSLRSFRLIWKGAVLMTIAQIGLGVLAVLPPALWFGWPVSWLVLGGFCLALSSTAVAFTILQDVDALKIRAGRMTIGVLIAQDLAIAPMLLIISGLKDYNFDHNSNIDTHIINEIAPIEQIESTGYGFGIILFELGLTLLILTLLIYYLSKRRRMDLFWMRLAEKRADLLPLIALATCFGIATLTGLIGLSPFFGAFIAGLVIGNSRQREVMRNSAEPVQVVLLMVFFVSVGLLFDLSYVWDHIWLILLIWLLVTVFKTVSNTLLAKMIGMSWKDSLTLAMVIAQLGEFNFVLAAVALGDGVIDEEIHKLIVAITVISLITSPLYVQLVKRNRHRALRHFDEWQDILRLIFSYERRLSRRICNFIKSKWLVLRQFMNKKKDPEQQTSTPILLEDKRDDKS